MPAVVRIKRRIDEEPLSAFLLNGKKRRIEDGGGSEGEGAVNNQAAAVIRNKELASKDEISTVLKFAGTIKEQDDTTQIMRLTKDAAKEIVQQRGKKSITNHTDRIRNEMRQSVRDQRYRVVNCMRTTLDATESNEITIVDIEEDKNTTAATKSTTQNKESRPTLVEERPTDSDTGYVYDLYLPENEQLVDDVDLMDDYLSFRAVNEWYNEDCYQNDEDSDDSEDSNQENYYTNDYPDEDSCNSSEDDIRDMADAIERFVMDDDDDEEGEQEENFAECSTDDEVEQHFYFDPYLDPRSVFNDDFADDVDDLDEEEQAAAYDAAMRRYELFSRVDEYDNASRNSNGEDCYENALEDAFHSASENGDDDDD